MAKRRNTRVSSVCVCLKRETLRRSQLKVELDLWSFEVLFLDGFTTVFIKSTGSLQAMFKDRRPLPGL